MKVAHPISSLVKSIDCPFISACIKGRHRRVRELLNQGADPYTVYMGEPIAFTVAQSRHVDVMRLLIQYGFDPKTTNQRGETILHRATEYRSHDMIVDLIERHGLDPHVRDRYGVTLLMIAARSGDDTTFDLLDRYGIDPFAQDEWGRNALHHAVDHAVHNSTRLSIIHRLITRYGLDPDSLDNDQNTPFIIATQNGDLTTMRALIKLGANPHHSNRFKRNALHIAAPKGNTRVIAELVIVDNLDPNAQDWLGRTPFILAAHHGNIPALRCLAALGANPYLTDHRKKNALHYATENGEDLAVRYLIRFHHFDPNICHEGVPPPLILAMSGRHTAAARALLQQGANPFLRDRQGWNAWDIARSHGIDPKTFKPSPSILL